MKITIRNGNPIIKNIKIVDEKNVKYNGTTYIFYDFLCKLATEIYPFMKFKVLVPSYTDYNMRINCTYKGHEKIVVRTLPNDDLIIDKEYILKKINQMIENIDNFIDGVDGVNYIIVNIEDN